MNIAWFTPFNHKSAIAKVSKIIVEKLSESHKIDLWVHEDLSEQLPTIVNKIRYSSSDDHFDISQYDIVIYNFGNNDTFHGPIYKVSKKNPGVIILHDYTLHIFFDELFKANPEKYISLLNHYYGRSISKEAQYLIENQRFPRLSRTDHFIELPLFEPILDSMLGCFVHSKFSLSNVKSCFYKPTSFSYLPYSEKQIKQSDKIEFKLKLGLPLDKIILISTGIIHPVKRIHKFLEALGESCNNHLFYYCLVGEYDTYYFQELQEIIKKYNLLASVRFLGWATEDVLEEYLCAADIAINLRYPNTEGCSYSAIEQLSHGLGLICTDSGFYNELPDNITFKIDKYNEIHSIKSVIESINMQSQISDISKNAIEFSKNNFSLDLYCKKLLDFLQTVISKKNETAYLENYLSWVSDQMFFLNGSYSQNISHQIDNLISELTPHLNQHKTSTDSKTLGFWFAFPYETGLSREGITRFACSFVKSLIEELDYNIEVWCFEINRKELEVAFNEIFSQLKSNSKHLKLQILTEKNYFSSLDLNKFSDGTQILNNWYISPEEDNLHLLVNKYSNATKFIIPIIYLSNSIYLNKKLIVAAHDLQPLANYEDFTKKHFSQIINIKNIYESAKKLANKGAFFFSNSQYVLNTQIRHYIKGVDSKNSGYVYLPGNISKCSIEPVYHQNFRNKFGLHKPYIFLATQLRPYKNFLTLLKACLLVPEIMQKYEIITTADLSSDLESKKLIETSSLKKNVRSVNSLNEKDLQLFYLNCDFVVVPTFFEGGFPWQAIEAMTFNKPVLISDIPITNERLYSEGFNKFDYNFMLFNPNSEFDLKQKIEEFLKDKTGFFEKQKYISKKILDYDWKKAIQSYAKLLDL